MKSETSHIQQIEKSVKTSSPKEVENSKNTKTPFERTVSSFALIGGPPPDIQLTPQNILYLQKTIGNEAVGQLVQTKLKVGQPGDKYEQEADQVPDAVMRNPEKQVKTQEEDKQVITKTITQKITPFIQLQNEDEEREEETVQTQLISGPLIRRINEEDEREESIQTKTLSKHPILQRQEVKEKEKPIIRKGISSRTHQIENDLSARLNQSRNSGHSLPEADRSFMEKRFGINFNAIRVHTDNNAVQMNRELNAQAFTYGKNIYFGAGKYNPGTSSGKRILAHEITHVVQQRAIDLNRAHPTSVSNKIQLIENREPKNNGIAQPKFVEGTIQRENESLLPQEFIPRTSADPDMAFLYLFQHHIHTWRIENWQDAPANSYFHWGWGVDYYDDVLKAIGDDSQNAGSMRLIWVQAMKPGNTRIQGTIVYQVPGGPRLVGETRYANITVFEPTLELLSIMPRKADGSGAESDHLSPGDKLIVRVKVGNVDGEHMEDPSLVSRSGQGQELVSFGSPLLTPVQQFADGKSYDVEIIANTPGSLNLELELGIGRTILGRGPSVSNITGEIEFDRQQFINLCNQCDTKISLAYTRANSVMEVLSAAYGNAYESHRDTLRAQSASNQLAAQIILGAALAFIPGGVGGVVGNFMKNAEVGNFLADAIKDMAKAGVKGVQSAILPSGGGSVMRPMGTDPRTWRAQYAVRVNTEKERVLSILDEWKTKANTSDPNFYLNFNPVTVTEQSLVQNGQPLKDIPVPDLAEHQRLFELGFWREWLQTFAYTVIPIQSYMGVRYTTQENQGKKIRNRINALRENGDQWLERYGGIARRRAEAEAERRNRARYE